MSFPWNPSFEGVTPRFLHMVINSPEIPQPYTEHRWLGTERPRELGDIESADGKGEVGEMVGWGWEVLESAPFSPDTNHLVAFRGKSIELPMAFQQAFA